MIGLDYYDYSARIYDPVTTRFTTMDPLSEKDYSISPYVFCNNNPVKFVNPNGKDIVIYYKNGNAEERRVITGAEAKTAHANGEFPQGYVRTDHADHGNIRVSNPTKITPMPTTSPQQGQDKSNSFWNSLLK